ncbi:MAG: thioredoxin domain-containing protein [Blastopirellula sp.]|nr:MAG: thioredoxin domain-containing protein [Blastopirellula sp.]
MTNRLADQTSPYLLQHAENPVNWFPWEDEALQKSKLENKPIFLSIGYSACHWCHVMEHESFENQTIADQLNENFISIKVDREERPDLDQIYMNAVQMLTGRGGWPMSVFLTPDLKPFYGGTYWPPTASRGMPGFDQVLNAVLDAWNNRPNEAIKQSEMLTERMQQIGQSSASDSFDSKLVQDQAYQALHQAFDYENGGFGRAPKFPHTMDLHFLLNRIGQAESDRSLEMVTRNLDKMAAGGIYDHLVGGFARYSVDERWLVPHFEKMLYDNGLLTGAYLSGYQATKNPNYLTVALETCDYQLKYMTDEAGGFHSTEDADSEGVEGKFYVWTMEEIKSILGEERGQLFCDCYDVSPQGNFEGNNILNLPKSLSGIAEEKPIDETTLIQQLSDAKLKLLAVRDQRIRPGKDDKILVSWNALMIDSMARAASISQEPKYLTAAVNAANFIFEKMTREDGRLLHTYRHGTAKLDAYLDDYTYLADCCVTLYESTFDEIWIDRAVDLIETVKTHFHDEAKGGFFYTADDQQQLIARNKDFYDNSVPSGNAMAATVLQRLGKLLGRQDYLDLADTTVKAAASVLQNQPTASGQMLVALQMLSQPFREVVVIADPADEETQEFLKQLHQYYMPNTVVACRAAGASENQSSHLDPIFAGKQAIDGQLTVYVCENFACHEPVSGAAFLERLQQ